MQRHHSPCQEALDTVEQRTPAGSHQPRQHGWLPKSCSDWTAWNCEASINAALIECEGPGQGRSPEGGVQAQQFERQEELLESLAELTRTRPSDRSLAPDFRLQLQLLECSVQQHRLLRHVLEEQRRAAQRFESLHSHDVEGQRQLQQSIEELSLRFESRSPMQGSLMQQPGTPPRLAVESASLPSPSVVPSPCAVLEAAWKSGGEGGVAPSNSSQPKGLFPTARCLSWRTTSASSETSRSTFRRFVSSSQFDLLCGIIIVCNAVTIGISINQSIVWQIDHVGGSEALQPRYIKYADYGFILFYTIELLLKLSAFGCSFFKGESWKWNLFDLILVLVGVYDLVIDVLGEIRDINVTWMRLLRLVRMIKLLRVVRIMRFFRVLRMMVSSIAGSLMTLMWSILMLSLMMYVFGLTFLQIISGHLSETSEVSPALMDLINTYWSSVYQSIVTLFYVVTGGSDWEPLAQPVRAAGEGYFLLFIFYVSFTAIAVLNVLTGLYVDTANKISQADDETVGEELLRRKETIEFIKFFRGFRDEQKDDPRDYISLDILEHTFQSQQVQAFMRLTQLGPAELKRVFRALDCVLEGKVLLSEFVEGCVHTKSATVALDMIALTSETRKIADQQTRLVDTLEKRFSELNKAVSATGVSSEQLLNGVKSQYRGNAAVT
mmetsp:Transcript_23780/g.55476  ORF Transcript_23780/g.55476 Transcript_23780/m.55476 type:complete len:665 (+) Transcript_23780:52-2046(+)